MELWDFTAAAAAVEHENVYSHLIPMTTATGRENYVP